MDRKIRKQIIEMLHEIRKGLDYSKASSSAAMLEECIAALQSIRDILAGYLSAARFAVYDEVFSGIIEALQDGVQQNLAGSQLAETVRLLQDLLQYLEDLLLKEKEIKKEIVFLPYKASMWDSLETIWQAANEDKEHCNAYVVPIPYAERNQDGTAREWHHEIGLFPENVPVIDYHQLDLEQLHPDIIYIHNPYDHRNLVTSVDERFYSYNLKKYTDKLVYVPYCVSGKHVSQGMCETSALQYADHVILESEGIKEQYERYYPYGPVPEGKFLALGSPKYDKVKLAKKEDYPLPKAWADLVRGKKVILYATTIHDQLKNYERTIQKLESILEFFKQRDDVVLWWRPHPLLQNTFDTMRPSICDKYRAIVERYKAEGWGIYDESGDLDCAIAWSDAYYGDGSSLIYLYRVTGKPVILTDFNLSVQEDNCKLVFCSPCFVENKNYFVPINFDSLFAFDSTTNKLQMVDRLQHNADDDSAITFGGVVQAGTKLLAYPNGFNSSDFVEYDLQTGQQRSFPYKEMSNSITSLKFFQQFRYENKIYFVKCCLFEILVYDIATGEFSLVDTSSLVNLLRKDENAQFCYSALQAEDKLYIVVLETNCLLCFDMKEESFQQYTIGSEDVKIIHFDKGTEDFCLLTQNRDLLLWQPGKEGIRCVELSASEVGDQNIEIRNISYRGEMIYLMVSDVQNNFLTYQLNLQTMQLGVMGYSLHAEEIHCIEKMSDTSIFLVGADGGRTFAGMLDLHTGEKDISSLSLPDELHQQLAEKYLSSAQNQCSAIIPEGFISLNRLLRFLHEEKAVGAKRQEAVLAGEAIYRYFAN